MARQIFRLSEHERDLLLQYCEFYLALATGARQPATDAQRHFTAVCRGEAEPTTDHELAFLEFRKLVELSRMTVRQLIAHDFLVEAPVGEGTQAFKSAGPSRAVQTGSSSIIGWEEIDEYGEGIPRPGWFSDDGWRRMRSGYRSDSRG